MNCKREVLNMHIFHIVRAIVEREFFSQQSGFVHATGFSVGEQKLRADKSLLPQRINFCCRMILVWQFFLEKYFFFSNNFSY